MFDNAVFPCLERERVARNKSLPFREVRGEDMGGHGLDVRECSQSSQQGIELAFSVCNQNTRAIYGWPSTSRPPE